MQDENVACHDIGSSKSVYSAGFVFTIIITFCHSRPMPFMSMY